MPCFTAFPPVKPCAAACSLSDTTTPPLFSGISNSPLYYYYSSISRPDIQPPLAMNSTSFLTSFVLTTLLLGLLPSSTAFTPSSLKLLKYPSAQTQQSGGIPTELFERISDKRREQLGIGEGEDEYDLGKALERNTVRNHRHQEQ